MKYNYFGMQFLMFSGLICTWNSFLNYWCVEDHGSYIDRKYLAAWSWTSARLLISKLRKMSLSRKFDKKQTWYGFTWKGLGYLNFAFSFAYHYNFWFLLKYICHWHRHGGWVEFRYVKMLKYILSVSFYVIISVVQGSIRSKIRVTVNIVWSIQHD